MDFSSNLTLSGQQQPMGYPAGGQPVYVQQQRPGGMGAGAGAGAGMLGAYKTMVGGGNKLIGRVY
jgi:hypothetical protein